MQWREERKACKEGEREETKSIPVGEKGIERVRGRERRWRASQQRKLHREIDNVVEREERELHERGGKLMQREREVHVRMSTCEKERDYSLSTTFGGCSYAT